MEKYPITARSLEPFFHIDGNLFERQYKDHLSGYAHWSELAHADKWLIYPQNIGRSICIDETSLSNGELYTIVTNRVARCKKGSIIAIVSGVKAEDVISALKHIPEELREGVEEITLDMSNSMRKIAKCSFPKAIRVVDRFHLQQMACDAIQQMRIDLRWDAIQEETDAMEDAKWTGKPYQPFVFANGDTKKQLLVRSRYLLFKSPEKWSNSQKVRAQILFAQYPELKKAYSLTHSLRIIFNKRHTKDSARLSLARWYNNVAESEFKSFNTIAATINEHYDEILNFFVSRATNAYAESFNAKIKSFRSQLRGVVDVKFFLFRLCNLFA